MSKLVFVYGTLKRGYGNNSLLRNAKFVGEATTCEDTFFMYTNGSYPYVLQHGTFHVKGELYEVVDEHTEQALDWLEGVPFHYFRTPVTAKLTSGGDCIPAEMYVASEATAERVTKMHPPVLPDDNNILEWNR